MPGMRLPALPCPAVAGTGRDRRQLIRQEEQVGQIHEVNAPQQQRQQQRGRAGPAAEKLNHRCTVLLGFMHHIPGNIDAAGSREGTAAMACRRKKSFLVVGPIS